MQDAQLFIEILVEELPALPFLREFGNFAEKWEASLASKGITADGQFYFTPRRMIIFSPNFPLKTEDSLQEVYGPPVAIAFENGDKNAALKPAGQAFLTKNEIKREDLTYKLKDGKEVLFYSKQVAGIETSILLKEVLDCFLKSLHFGKPMRWGEVQSSFIRPIRNVMIYLDSSFIQFCGYGILGKPSTLLRKNDGYEWVEISSFCEYQEVMDSHGVLINQNERRAVILEQIATLEKKHDIAVELDAELLDEVVAITESPKVLLGSFDSKFLELPKEIIITSMKENQRYFAVYEDAKHEKLKNHFIVVSNAMCKDFSLVLSGNEKVLRARLEDAMFFYQNDLNKGLDVEGLKNIGFIDNAGSMLDKTEREIKIATFLLSYLNISGVDKEELIEAIRLSKADLLSEVVYEFSSLQGIMGYYYALKMGKPHAVALAIKEQYMGDGSVLPSSILGAIVALSYRLDNIFTLFANGKIPTGSKDPFALRRAANIVIRIALKFELDFRLDSLFASLCEVLGLDMEYAKRVEVFFNERLEGIFEVNASVIKAVLAGEACSLCEMAQKLEALDYAIKNEKQAYITTFKRVANILKDKPNNISKISQELLIEDAEKELFAAYEGIKNSFNLSDENSRIKDYKEYMQALSGLRVQLDCFFDSVLVNIEDEALKNNRIALVASIYQAFLKVGDMKEISI